ncbi:MAG: hypothetical protein NTU49_02785 [Gammaproteobacteria bacterium]|nr:hypothetical protein [Gammaproteobacteria bacterium]
MLTLNNFEVAIPKNLVSIMNLKDETKFSKEMLSVYRLIYGLKTISVLENCNLMSLIELPLKKILETYHDISKIKYLIYVHTTGIILPFGCSLLTCLKEKYNLDTVISFQMTMQKCASYFKALEILTVLLEKCQACSAIVLTGEVAFTPLLRVVPGSSIVGDAATASLFTYGGSNHQLLAVYNHLMTGYSKGIYLTDWEIKIFDSQFIDAIVDIISKVILKANITLNQIALILPHNVNIPTWKKISAALHFPIEKIYLNNIAKFGHTFCSDHVINLQSALSENRLNKGDYYLMVGCGMGFYLSAAVFVY